MEKEIRAKRRKRTLLKQEKRLALMRALGMQGGMLYEKHRKKAQRSGGYMRDGNVSHFVSTKPRKCTRDRSRINNYDNRVKNGLFTGKYTAQGLALLKTRTGDTWCITPAHLFDAPEKVKRD